MGLLDSISNAVDSVTNSSAWDSATSAVSSAAGWVGDKFNQGLDYTNSLLEKAYEKPYVVKGLSYAQDLITIGQNAHFNEVDMNLIDAAHNFLTGSLSSKFKEGSNLLDTLDGIFMGTQIEDWDGDTLLDCLVDLGEKEGEDEPWYLSMWGPTSTIGKIKEWANEGSKFLDDAYKYSHKYGILMDQTEKLMDIKNKYFNFGSMTGKLSLPPKERTELTELAEIMSRPEHITNPLVRFSAMGDRIKDIVLEMGVIADKEQAIRYSRLMHFITRPTLESDSGGYYRSYAYFVRPNCNLIRVENDKVLAHPQLVHYERFSALVKEDLELTSELTRDDIHNKYLFTFLNNHIKEISAPKLNDTSREGIRNMNNVQTPLPGAPEFYNTDVSVTFIDNSYGHVAKILYILSMYKHAVFNEGYMMRPEYVKHQAWDFYMSLYVFTVDPDFNIIGMTSYLNMTINEPPTHFVQHRMDGFTKDELLGEFSVTFKASTVFPHDPSRYDAFNRISGFDPRCIADTKGVEKVLTIPVTSGTYEVKPWRTSVWDADGGFNPTKSVALPQAKKLFEKTTTLLSYKRKGFAEILADYTKERWPEYFQRAAKWQAANRFQAEYGSKTPYYKVNAQFMSRGIFELCCTRPGIYTVDLYSKGDKFVRRMFRLGWSR